MFKVILGVLFFTIITLVVFINLDPNVTAPGSVVTSTLNADFLTATITGEIQKTGTYILEKEATLSDLIALAGGTTSNADSLAYEPSLTLLDGQDYYIAPTFDPSDVCGSTALVKVGINTANKEGLMTLSNIGTSLADGIIDYRKQHGSFTYLEAIMNVSGIGQSTFTRIKNYITLA